MNKFKNNKNEYVNHIKTLIVFLYIFLPKTNHSLNFIKNPKSSCSPEPNLQRLGNTTPSQCRTNVKNF